MVPTSQKEQTVYTLLKDYNRTAKNLLIIKSKPRKRIQLNSLNIKHKRLLKILDEK